MANIHLTLYSDYRRAGISNETLARTCDPAKRVERLAAASAYMALANSHRALAALYLSMSPESEPLAEIPISVDLG
jgi:hypothetical protein